MPRVFEPLACRMEPMEETPRKSSWYFEDDKGEASATVFPHPKPVPAVRLKVRSVAEQGATQTERV